LKDSTYGWCWLVVQNLLDLSLDLGGELGEDIQRLDIFDDLLGLGKSACTHVDNASGLAASGPFTDLGAAELKVSAVCSFLAINS
jgi:hypothetical protein